MTGDRPTTPGWHCHRCRSTSCRQRADSDTDHVGRVEYRPLLLTQPSSVSWLWSHTHWCPSQRPQEVMRVDGSANPTMPKNPAQKRVCGCWVEHNRRTRPTSPQTVPRLAAMTVARPQLVCVPLSLSGVNTPTRSSVTVSPDFAALGEPRQRFRWHAALCDRSLESSSSAAHTLCTVDTAYCAATTAVTAMGSPSLALSHLCCGLCERHCSATAGTL